MNNADLLLKVEEIVTEANYFDMYVKAISFNEEYKKSDFFKLTKKPLMEVIKEMKMMRMTDPSVLINTVKEEFENFDAQKILSIIESFGEILQNENNEILDNIKITKNLVDELGVGRK